MTRGDWVIVAMIGFGLVAVVLGWIAFSGSADDSDPYEDSDHWGPL